MNNYNGMPQEDCASLHVQCFTSVSSRGPPAFTGSGCRYPDERVREAKSEILRPRAAERGAGVCVFAFNAEARARPGGVDLGAKGQGSRSTQCPSPPGGLRVDQGLLRPFGTPGPGTIQVVLKQQILSQLQQAGWPSVPRPGKPKGQKHPCCPC